MRLLDRYLLRSFLLPFIYCLVGFLAVWLIFDLSGNSQAFIENGVGPVSIFWFYLTQLPSIAIITLPVGLLLALLYSLGRMSQSNEILSMLSAGVSLGRILTPFFSVGLMVTGLSTFLSYELAPRAEARKEQLLTEMDAGKSALEKYVFTLGHLFRNRTDNRLWFIEKLPNDLTKPLQGVQIIQQDGAGDIVRKLYAHTAVFNDAKREWTLTGAKVVDYSLAGDVKGEKYPAAQVISGWTETPWRIASSILEPDKLTVPELREYLQLNADFTGAQLAPFRTYLDYRWALPWSCMVVVCVSAPLGIVYSRRSVLAGVASSIFIFFLILFLTNLFLALGRGDRMTSFWAAWTPNLLFTLVGLVLLRVRALNRDRLPLTPRLFWDFLTAH